MTFPLILFYSLSVVLIVSSLRVVTASNPVHATLFLVLSFFTAAALWLLIGAEFLAITLVLVYVGAVMVLFLFVLMMLDINVDELRKGFWSNLPSAIVVGSLMMFEIAMLMYLYSTDRDQDLGVVFEKMKDVDNTKELGIQIYTTYLYSFELSAVILLLAIVAVVGLVMKDRGNKTSKTNDVADQVSVSRGDRIRLVKVDAVVKQADVNQPADSETTRTIQN